MDVVNEYVMRTPHARKEGIIQEERRGGNEKVAERTGLEPATLGVTGRYSNRLNYRSAKTNNLKVVGSEGLEPPTLAL